MKQKTYRFRRLIATVIDWNLAWLPAFLLTALLLPLFQKELHPLLFIPIWAVFPVLFLNRDRLFKGRSPGNRLMKLTVLDRRTLQPLRGTSLITRNLFFLFGGLDLLVLLVTGSTLGDRTVAALVVPLDDIPQEPPKRPPVTKKSALKIVLIVALCIVVLIGIVQVALNSVKDEPHYALAYSYLLESEAFAQLNAEETQVRFTGFTQNTTTRNGVTETDAHFTFQVKGHQLMVTCHLEDDRWYVCEECTNFQ